MSINGTIYFICASPPPSLPTQWRTNSDKPYARGNATFQCGVGGGGGDGMSHCIGTTTYLLLQSVNQHSGETGKRYLVKSASYCLVGIDRCRFFSVNLTS